MDKFLETQNIPRLTHKKKTPENLNRPITNKETKSVSKSPNKEKPWTWWLPW